MTPTLRITVLAALAAAACGTMSGARSRFHQADYQQPGRAQFPDDAQRAIIEDAIIHASRADQAAMAGNLDQSRAENRVAADALVKFLDTFPSSEWRLVLRAQAADRYVRAQEFEKAAAQAQALVDDPEAQDVSKAIGSRLGATAWQTIANAKGRAGAIDPPRILTADKRKGQAPKPRVPPDPWKRFIENADRYQQVAAADPLAKLSPAEREKRGAVDTAQLALLSAEVEFGYDNMEDARRRFEAIMKNWPSRADVMESAVPYDLQTYLLLKDEAGYEAAVARALGIVKPEAARTAEAAKAPGASAEAKKDAEIMARLEGDLEKQQQGSGFVAAERLLAAGKLAEAAAAFEKFAAENPAHPDAPNALFNAGVAWEKAKEPKKAMAARAALLERYGDSRVAPQATLAQASALTKQGNNAAALKLYESYLAKWGQGPQRCLALQNLGVALESSGKKLEAARSYQSFARDPACLKDEPDNAVNLVYHAGILFGEARKRSDAQEMFRVVAGVQGVTGTVAKSQVEDARKRLRRK